MARYALIDDATKIVRNVIELEEGADWSPPPGQTLVKSDVASPGDTYASRKFVPAPVSPNPEDAARAAYAAASSTEKQRIVARRLGLED